MPLAEFDEELLARVIVEASEGSIRLEDIEIRGHSESQMRELRKRLQIVFQDPHASLNPAMRIGALVADPLRFHKIVSDRDELTVVPAIAGG